MPQPLPAKVEVKFAIVPQDTDKAVAGLGLITAPAEKRVIHFFDTSAFALFERGIILRARQTIVGDDEDDFTFKVRGSAAAGIAETFAAPATSTVKLEGDRSAGREEQLSFSITSKPGVEALDPVVEGTKGVPSILDDASKALFATLTQSISAPITLTSLGPIQSKTWKLKLPGFEGKLSAELWTIGETQLLEISDKKSPAEAEAFAAALVQHLTQTVGVQQLDTSKTLFAMHQLRQTVGA